VNRQRLDPVAVEDERNRADQLAADRREIAAARDACAFVGGKMGRAAADFPAGSLRRQRQVRRFGDDTLARQQHVSLTADFTGGFRVGATGRLERSFEVHGTREEVTWERREGDVHRAFPALDVAVEQLAMKFATKR
jgi:hypothetical protein